jgi:hypothetical protein
VVSSNERGGATSQPPVTSDSSQCRPERSMVSESVRTTWSTEKLAQTSSRERTPSRNDGARAASAVAFKAPAEAPTSTSNGHGASAGNQSAMAFRTPTW